MKPKKRVAIQGVQGANHEIAAREFFNDSDVEVVPCLTFAQLFEAVRNDNSLYGIVAIENTIAGSLQANYTLLNDSGLTVIGEYKLRIKHHLMAAPGVKIEDLKEVHSHPMAIMQCESFFRQYPQNRLVESDDTALAAKEVMDKKLTSVGAIATELAAEMYGLN